MSMKPIFDLTLCLIADSSMVPRGSTLTDVVSQAIQGGATAVLLHDKISSTRAFVELARSVHQVTQRNGVSLLISDRIDVALAAGAEGVHMGHDGMPLTEARSILGNDKIIGVSVGSAKQAQDAVAGGADYLGIGPCFVTTEDAHNEEPCGARGVRDIWQAALLAKDTTVKAVAMGGIGVDNAAHVFNYSRAQGRPLDGVAVGAAVMSADSPCAAAEQLVAQLRYASGTLWPALSRSPGDSPAAIVSAIAAVFSSARSSEVRPLVPHITNRVSATDCANACLALGASPIMEALADEQASLLAHAGALLINIGTLSLAAIAGMHAAVKAAGVHRTPVVLDPVAAGATPLRRALVAELLDTHGASVIKANAGEVAAVLGSAEVGMQGVDSVGAFANPVEAVVALSRMHRCVVTMTGVVDYVSNGDTTVAVRNGHAMQATVTGTGCLAGSAVATFVAFARDAPMLGVITGIVAVNLAAEHAARRPDVRGPGSFRPAFLDELHALTSEHILAEARIDMC